MVGMTGFEPATPSKSLIRADFWKIHGYSRFPCVDRESGESPSPIVPGQWRLVAGEFVGYSLTPTSRGPQFPFNFSQAQGKPNQLADLLDLVL